MPLDTNSANTLLARAAGSPDVYPQQLDLARSCTLLVAIDRALYRSASFLDDRVLTPGVSGSWVSTALLEQATQRLAAPRPLHLILHTGHVGSTLLSRLLEELGGSLVLREPLPLRTLAEAQDRLIVHKPCGSATDLVTLVDLFLRLWSRGYADTRQCIVKSTSSASRLASLLLERRPEMQAVYLCLLPEPYLATLLAGDNSLLDLRGHAEERAQRIRSLGAELTAPLQEMSPGMLAALGWLAESYTRHAVVSGFPSRILSLDFEELLADMPSTLGRVADHLNINADQRQIEVVASGGTMQRYSKAPEHAYSPALRTDILRDSRQRNAAEIRTGLQWLETMTRTHPQLAAAHGSAQ